MIWWKHSCVLNVTCRVSSIHLCPFVSVCASVTFDISCAECQWVFTFGCLWSVSSFIFDRRRERKGNLPLQVCPSDRQCDQWMWVELMKCTCQRWNVIPLLMDNFFTLLVHFGRMCLCVFVLTVWQVASGDSHHWSHFAACQHVWMSIKWFWFALSCTRSNNCVCQSALIYVLSFSQYICSRFTYSLALFYWWLFHVSERCKQLPERPKNGLVIAPRTEHGMKALYLCRDGFMLVGSNLTTCNYGKWTEATPVCQESKSFHHLHLAIFPFVFHPCKLHPSPATLHAWDIFYFIFLLKLHNNLSSRITSITTCTACVFSLSASSPSLHQVYLAPATLICLPKSLVLLWTFIIFCH